MTYYIVIRKLLMRERHAGLIAFVPLPSFMVNISMSVQYDVVCSILSVFFLKG